jgi:excisionase family DNA binding protein
MGGTGMDDGKVFSTFQAAKICHVAPVTIIRWIEAGRLESYKTPGGHRRIREQDLVTFIEENGLPRYSAGGISTPRVLVVDDEMVVRRFIQKSLEESVLESICEFSNDGIDALMKLGIFQPHLMVLDVNIPWVDGLEICRRIRSNENTRQIKIIVITGFLNDDDRDEILAAGADHLLFKPFDEGQLLDMVSQALGDASV